MTAHRDLKRHIRERQRRTDESYMAARTHVVRERDKLLGFADPRGLTSSPPEAVEAAVLKVNRQSARVRLLGGEEQITLRASGIRRLAPGMVVKLQLTKRWTYLGDAYALGEVEAASIDVARLGLSPLPLELDDRLEDFSAYEPFDDSDPYGPTYRHLTAEPRLSAEMHEIAWGAEAPGSDEDINILFEAAELAEAGDLDAARAVLMEVLCDDLRCIDAHAHLGNLAFDEPWVARIHYEIGMRIGELFLPPGFDGVLLWGRIYNRPFLRCLQGYAICQWRLGRVEEARRSFERVLSFNPPDNQGARVCLRDVLAGKTWEEALAPEEQPKARARRRR